MNDTIYVGEHLWIGQAGHFFIVLSFVTALLSSISYFIDVQKKSNDTGWALLGRNAFYVHGFSLIAFMSLIFYAMYNQYYEYSYVFDHVSPDLPLKYILSAFWEGQEGSFMLWMFWHVVLGILLIRSAGKFESATVFVIALADVILMSMILGIHIPWGDDAFRIGSNPTTLLRQINDAPIFANADYLTLIKGRGMNPLLQNYWMTIHPPTLFLGFASTIVPFAYAFAGLWKNEHQEWLHKALPWSLFSGAILGTGILMGSLWAYVALSFGGYWAWDPVENASLVPWITLVAGIHVHLISRNTGYAKRSVYFFYLISFVLILYSTFLTRSGILGDTSAHAFTEMGLEWQLIILVLTFLLLGAGLFAYRYNSIDQPKTEEALASREFWMFIGSLVLLFSSVLITSSTSLPVFNKIMTYYNPAYEGRVIKDVIGHYNKYQLWIAVFVAALSGISIFLRYSGTNWNFQKKKFAVRIMIALCMAAVLTYLTSFWLQFYSWQYIVMSFAGFFGIVTQIDYVINTAKGNLKLVWSATAHLGFGIMMLGMLASGLNQKAISTNPFVFKNMFSEEDVKKYVQLIKNKPLLSEGYLITYKSDTLIGRERRYDINFKKLDAQNQIVEDMTLHPNAVYSNDFSKVAAFNPDTKHYLTKDIFSCVVSLPPALSNVEEAQKIEDSLKFQTYLLPLNDTIHAGNFIIRCDSVTYQPTHPEYIKHSHDAGLSAHLSVTDAESDTVYRVETSLGMEGALLYNYPVAIEEAGIRMKLSESVAEDFITPDEGLEYKDFTIKPGAKVQIDGYDILLTGFDKNPQNPNYSREDKDIALAANMEIIHKNQKENVAPIYIIRDKQPMSIKSFAPKSGFHIRFSNIDPASETFTFRIARDKRMLKNLSLSMATDVPRTDYLILQATVFPGINLFWGGSILMMLGLFMAGWQRYTSLRK